MVLSSHCHSIVILVFGGSVYQPFIKPLILKPTQHIDRSRLSSSPAQLCLLFSPRKKRPRLFVRTKDMRRFNQLFGQGVTHSPPRKKKKLTSTKNIHLEIKLSRLMFYNNLITSPQSLVFPFCLKKKSIVFP